MRYRSLMFSLCLLFACQPVKEKTSTEKTHDLVGSWRFVADQELDKSNQISKQDTNVSGLLIYTADGKMSVQLLWKGTRKDMLNDSLMSHDGKSLGLGLGANTWTIEQARKMIDTYDAYFGTYTIDWDKQQVNHRLDGNLRPEKPGTTYNRSFRLIGDTLLLRSVDPTLKWQAAFVKNR